MDSHPANLVVGALEDRGVACWVAPRDVAAGGSCAESILDAIEGADCFVLIYSQNSNVSSHVLREVERALKFGVTTIPIRFDNSTLCKSLDYLLATVHWLTIAPEAPDRSVLKAAEQIVAAVAKSEKVSPARAHDRTSPAAVLVPVAARNGRLFPWIMAVLFLALAAGSIGYLLSRNLSPGKTAQEVEVASQRVATAATGGRASAESPNALDEVDRRDVKEALFSPAPARAYIPLATSTSHLTMYGIVSDPDGTTNVRERPTVRSSIIAVKPNGERVEIDRIRDGWAHVGLGPGRSGLIYANRLKISSEKH